MSADRYADMVATLLGQAPSPPAGLPGRRIVAKDEPIEVRYLVGVTSPTEYALLTGLTKQGAVYRLKKGARHE